MTGDEFTMSMNILSGTVMALRLLPLDELLETVQRAHTLGPILDPTSYIEGMSNLADSEKLLRSAIDLVKTANSLAPAGDQR